MDRSRDKWRSHLAKLQYENGLSTEEMDDLIEKLKAENIEKNAPIGNIETTTEGQGDFNHFDQIGKILRGTMTPRKK